MVGRFSRGVAFRVAGLVSTIVAGTVLAISGHFVVTPLLLVIVSVAQAVGLVRFVDRTNRELARFLASVKANDFKERFEREREGVGFDSLGRELEGLLARVKALRGQSEIDLRTVRAIVDQVPVPLIAVSPDGRVESLSQAARQFFGTLHVVRLVDLKPLGEAFVRTLETLEPGQAQLVTVGSSDRVLVRVNQVRSGGQARRIFSLLSLRSELESAEAEAWQALVRVLTHELMNSLTPVRSLAQTAAGLLEAGDAEAVQDAQVALQTVAKRADGLLRFIESYREIARVPQPKRRSISVADLFERVLSLFGDSGAKIETTVVPNNLAVRVDGEQIERVLINLVRNALDAAADVRIELRGWLDVRGRSAISVTDNGPGIPDDVARKMFVPFFTTKSDGSGVGLSLTRQIMGAHGGSVSYENIEPRGARFTLHF